MALPASRQRRRLLGAAVAVIAACAVTATAATLNGINGNAVGAGKSVVSSCDADGVTASYAINLSAVQSVTVSGVAGACTNGSMRVVLANSSGASVGAGGPTTVSGSSVVVSLSPQPQANTVAAVHVVVEGP